MSGPTLQPSLDEVAGLDINAFACELNGVMATTPSGETVPLSDCVWMEAAPCGCVSGVRTAVVGAEVLASPEAALRAMSDNAADYREDVRNGVRMVLVTFKDYRETAGELFKVDCPHTPRYGVVRQTREVAGITWTRMGSTYWSATLDDKHWRLEKWSNRWHLQGPKQGPGRYESPWMGMGKLDEALDRASAYVAAHPDGLERAS